MTPATAVPEPRLSTAVHLPGLDLLRFLATLAVVVTHFVYSIPTTIHVGPSFYPFDRVMRYGYLSVDLFFMISGYAILKSARHKTLRQFVVARVVRLYPLFWLSCLLTFISLRFGGAGLVPGGASIRQLLLNLTLLPEFFGAPFLNGVCWTLTYELAFYFLVALLIACRLWDNIMWVIAGWLAYTLAAGPLAAVSYFSFLFIPKYSACFIAGMLFYLLQTRSIAAWKIYVALAATLALALRSARATREVVQTFYHDPVPYNLLAVAAITALFFGLLYLAVRRTPQQQPHPFWVLLGQLTYPLYLLHPVGVLGLWLLNGKVNKYLLLTGTVAAAVAIAWLAHRFVERPGSKLLARKTNQLFAYLRPAAAPAAAVL